MKNKKTLTENPALVSFLASVGALVLGLLVGIITLMIFNISKTGFGIKQILTAGFSSVFKITKVLYKATPILMTGLSVSFAYKTGLFNIGASGQFTVGAFFALFGAMVLKLPWWACLVLAMIGGAVWGIFPGLFKAYFNVNEVITAIMFNWIGLFLVNLLVSNIPIMLSNYHGGSTSERTAKLQIAGEQAILPTLGLDKVFNSSYVNIGILIAILFAILIHIVLNKTTFGYELKACGFNKDASNYAGINAKRNIILSMIIAGALAGVGGGLYYLSGTVQYVIEKSVTAMGFNGIVVALLGNSSPLGSILSAFFISYIQVGGEALQPVYVQEMIDIIIAAIIYMSAFSVLMQNVIVDFFKKKKDKKEGAVE